MSLYEVQFNDVNANNNSDEDSNVEGGNGRPASRDRELRIATAGRLAPTQQLSEIIGRVVAIWLKTLLNKPGDDGAYHKVDCGQLSDDKELFGMSGAHHGSQEGSALNNFILRISEDPDARGIVLLDEIEKADRGVIHGLYQVLDKGEWTNKKLESGSKAQTETVSCHNIIFIMTTNSADKLIITTQHPRY